MPDYTSSFSKVYTQMTINFLLSRMDLDIFGDLFDPEPYIVDGMITPHKDPRLPTWVPDFREVHGKRSLDGANWKESGDKDYWRMMFEASSKSIVPNDKKLSRQRAFRASLDIPPPSSYNFSPDLKVFSLDGIMVDTVSDVSPHWPKIDDVSRRRCLYEWKDMFLTGNRDKDYPHGGLKCAEAFWRTVLCNIYWPDHSADEPFPELPARVDGRFDIPPAIGTEEQGLIDFICTWPSETVCQLPWRKMFVTTSGLLGLGPPSTSVGDMVAVLMGGRFPIILRQSKDKFEYDTSKSDKTYHRVIGERYVQKHQYLLTGISVENGDADHFGVSVTSTGLCKGRRS
ncbi:heterokaryon incompatibility protein [Apiospora hydei]|uniref:Heterokaryon incompatibility protein n=1 Tax=Apiospora hydei TaxID=1337664 RepID=A0ABR1UUR3_9PEZI